MYIDLQQEIKSRLFSHNIYIVLQQHNPSRLLRKTRVHVQTVLTLLPSFTTSIAN